MTETARVDTSGIRLLIATPCMSGLFDYNYVASLLHTMATLSRSGIVGSWIVENFNADVSAARDSLMEQFLNSDHTHLLMIDADIGWPSEAIGRMLFSRKDLVAIPNPKKSYPLKYGVNVRDGKPLEFLPESQTCKVSEVSTACMMISRVCAEKMITAYPETYHLGNPSDVRHGLFMPLMRDGLRKAEDYAFCVRWTDIGGEVHVIPDIPLKHTGNHTFEGSILTRSTLPEAG